MILEYKFEYVSNNNTLISFLDNILDKKDVNYKILRKKDLIFLYIEEDEEELLSLANELSLKLPMSIFLINYTLEVVSQIPASFYNRTTDDFNLSYCSSCIVTIEDKTSNNYYNPFFSCDICGTTCEVNNLNTLKLFENENKIEYKNYKQLFESLAYQMSKNKKIKIKTSSGVFVFYALKDKVEKNSKLLCTNINNLAKLVVATKEDTVALLSIEKPSMDFKINEIYKINNNTTIDKINIRYSDDLILYLLSKELVSYDIDFLCCENSSFYDFELTYNLDIKDINRVKIVINDSKKLFLENKNYDKKLNKIYEEFDDKSKAQFMVLIDENDLYDKSILNLFTSTKSNDNICLYSKKIDGMIDILNYKIPSTINSLFEDISKEETGKKLLENYKTKFNINYENAINCDISKLDINSMFSLWKIVAVILGFTKVIEEENIIMQNAISSILQKGPRVDYKLHKSDKIFNKEFDILKLIKSGMSFKLAGVDDKTLCLGYLESYTYFLSDIIDEINSEFELDGVSLCGDLISDSLFYNLLKKAITKNFKLYYNKDFPINY